MDEQYFEDQQFEGLRYSGETFAYLRFTDCTFVDCVFEECRLVGCSFAGCTFQKCKIIRLKAADHTQIQYAAFTGCHLLSIPWGDLQPAGRFAEPIRKLEDCCLRYNTFVEMNLQKFDFSEAEICDSMFAQCQLTECNFSHCNLERTEFFQCDLRKADFRNACGYQIELMSSQLRGARFSFPEVVRLLDSMEIKID